MSTPTSAANRGGYETDPAPSLARRLAPLPVADVDGRTVRVARGPRARALGLAFLHAERAGGGLLLPGCRSVHTFGMRFPLDIAFIDAEGAVLSRRRDVPAGRVVFDRRAAAVLEVPAEEGA